MRPEVYVGLLGDPGGLTERCHQLGCARDECNGVRDSVSTLVAVPAPGHVTTLQATPDGTPPSRALIGGGYLADHASPPVALPRPRHRARRTGRPRGQRSRS